MRDVPLEQLMKERPLREKLADFFDKDWREWLELSGNLIVAALFTWGFIVGPILLVILISGMVTR